MLLKLSDEQVLEMGRLAVLASRKVGMGILQDDSMLKTTADVPLEIRKDHNPGLFIDYYQGRMVKLRAWKKEDGWWEFPDQISHEYESWVWKYPNYQALAETVTGVKREL